MSELYVHSAVAGRQHQWRAGVSGSRGLRQPDVLPAEYGTQGKHCDVITGEYPKEGNPSRGTLLILLKS